MSAVWALCALLVMMCGGVGFASALLGRMRVSAMEFAGCAVMFGSLWISAGMFGLGAVLHGSALVEVLSALSIVVGVMGFFPVRAVGFVPLGRWLTVAVGVATGIVLAYALVLPLNQDGVFNFEFSARIAAANGGSVPQSFGVDPSRVWMHATYPPLVSLCEAWVYLWMGGPHQVWVKLLGALWFFGAASFLTGNVARVTGSSTRAAVALTLLLATPGIALVPGGAAWTWADFPLAVFVLFAVSWIATIRDEPRGGRMVAASLAGMVWVKQEGLVFSVLILGAMAWNHPANGRWRAVAAGMVAMMVTVAVWKGHLIWDSVLSTKEFYPVTEIVDHVGRAPRIMRWMGEELIVWRRWALFWLLVIITLPRLRRPELAAWRAVVFGAVAALALYVGVYSLTTWQSVHLHIFTSFPRLLIPVAMIMVAFLAHAWPCGTADEKPSEGA